MCENLYISVNLSQFYTHCVFLCFRDTCAINVFAVFVRSFLHYIYDIFFFLWFILHTLCVRFDRKYSRFSIVIFFLLFPLVFPFSCFAYRFFDFNFLLFLIVSMLALDWCVQFGLGWLIQFNRQETRRRKQTKINIRS